MENVNEGRSQIKRQYGEYSKIRVNEKAPIRNKVLNFVGKRFVTEDEMKNHLTKLTEEIGKEFDQRKWFKNNQRYFESFENRGQKVLTLSKYGKRVHEFINKPKENTVNESTEPVRIGLFKSSLFESFSINEAFAKDEGIDTLEVLYKERESETAEYGWEQGEGGCDMKLLKKQFDELCKHLKGNYKTVVSDMSEGSYELVTALNIGLNKRRNDGDANIKLVSEFNFLSPWDSANTKQNVWHWHIVDANIDVLTFEDGDDFASFSYIACLKKDLKNLIKWVNTNMSEADMGY